MVLPKNDPAFQWSDESEGRAKMTAYIRKHFSGILGDDARLLDMANGLELVQEKAHARLARSGISLGRAQAAA